MIGAEILTWGTQGEDNPYYYPLYHYLWGGSIGHAAIKLTLPGDEATLALVRQYCCDQEGRSVIPHYRHHHHVIVYFSWWPDALMEEYQDRLEANSGLSVEYEKKWQPHFMQTTEQKSGILRFKLGALYDWIYGKPKMIPVPISEIVHPHPEAESTAKKLAALEALLDEKTQTLLPLVTLIESLEEQINLLSFIKHFATDKQQQDELCKQAQAELAEMEEVLKPHIEECKELNTELKSLRRYYYQEIASIGLTPDVVHLPLSEAFSPSKMLAKMREIVDGPVRFDKIFYNCSTVTREIIDAGLAKALKISDCAPHWFDTPLKIHRLACKLQVQLINLRQKEFLPQFSSRPRHAHAPRRQGEDLQQKASLVMRPS